MRTAVTIAGSDSSGGAGIQADIKTMMANGVYAMSAITALTAQNTTGVTSILNATPEFLGQELDAIFTDIYPDAVKIGMVSESGLIRTIAAKLRQYEAKNIVVDPVMVAGTGSTLMQDDLANALRRKLLPICELVTPNKSEAEVLAKMKIKTKDDERFAAELIGKQGSAVLMKGGHYNTPTVVDFLYLSSEFTKMEYPRLKKAGHGSGCVLSSYITANMAKGMDVANAVFKSREMIQDAIASQYVIGHGDMVVNPCVKEGESDGFMVLDALDSAASRILDIVPEEFVPKNGMNIAMAMRNAAGPEEIAAIDKRLTVHNGMIRKGGPAKFGTAEGLSYILMAVMKHDPESRCIMSLSCTREMLDVMEEVGMRVVPVELAKDKFMESTEKAISGCGELPDALVDKAAKKDRIVRLLAKDTTDMLSKLEEII